MYERRDNKRGVGHPPVMDDVVESFYYPKKMKRLDHAVPTLLAGLALLASCSPPIKSVEKRALPRPNPTNYTFPLPVAEVHEKAWRAFSI